MVKPETLFFAFEKRTDSFNVANTEDINKK
jgi:hypothetical protein